MSDYSKSIKINSDDSDSYLNRGLIYFEIGKNQFACLDFKVAASLGNQFLASWLESDEAQRCLKSDLYIKSVLLF